MSGCGCVDHGVSERLVPKHAPLQSSDWQGRPLPARTLQHAGWDGKPRRSEANDGEEGRYSGVNTVHSRYKTIRPDGTIPAISSGACVGCGGRGVMLRVT